MSLQQQPKLNRLQIRLSSTLLLLTTIAIALAWYVDHRRLKEIIGEPEIKMSAVYRLSNASANLVANRIDDLYDEKTAIVKGEPVSNSLMVCANQGALSQIEELVRQFDRQGTEFVEKPIAEPGPQPTD